MTRIFFKTIWNNRRRNILVFIELFMISLILLNLTVYLVNIMSIYRIKNCYNSDNVILIRVSNKEKEDEKITEESFQNLISNFKSNDFVESVSISNNALPYNYSLYSTNFKYENNTFNLALRQVDIDYSKVMKITPLKGRWFNDTDRGKSTSPIIISPDIEAKYFNGNAPGKIIVEGKNSYEIIGVVDHFKRGDTEKPISFGFTFKDKIRNSWWGISFLIRTKNGKTGEMLAIAERQVSSTLNPDKWTIESLNSLENMKNRQNYDTAQGNLLILIIALFIMINVFLGTVGILWYNTNLRIHEIGLKRALGSTGRGIKRWLIAENMFLAGLSIFIVILAFLQSPSFIDSKRIQPGVLSLSIYISIALMIILVFISTWIPASIASKIRPATALKTE
jgi:putative ABC transport system permease protein